MHLKAIFFASAWTVSVLSLLGIGYYIASDIDLRPDNPAFTSAMNSLKENNPQIDELTLYLLLESFHCFYNASEADLTRGAVIGFENEEPVYIQARNMRRLKRSLGDLRQQQLPETHALITLLYDFPLRKTGEIIEAHVTDDEKIIMLNNRQFFEPIFNSYKQNFKLRTRLQILEKRIYIGGTSKVSALEFLGGRLIYFALNSLN